MKLTFSSLQKRSFQLYVLLSQCRPCDMLEGISSQSFYILHVCMHVNQTKLEKNITCKEEKQGTSSKGLKQLESYDQRNQEIEHSGDFLFFSSAPMQQSAAEAAQSILLKGHNQFYYNVPFSTLNVRAYLEYTYFKQPSINY